MCMMEASRIDACNMRLLPIWLLVCIKEERRASDWRLCRHRERDLPVPPMCCRDFRFYILRRSLRLAGAIECPGSSNPVWSTPRRLSFRGLSMVLSPVLPRSCPWHARRHPLGREVYDVAARLDMLLLSALLYTSNVAPTHLYDIVSPT